MNPGELDSRNFATAAEAAAILDGADPRTIRAAIKAGEIPGVQVGTRWMVPTAWLRQQVAGGIQPIETGPGFDLDQLADRVADRVAVKILRAFAALAPDSTAAGPSPGPAAAADSHPAKEARHAQRTSAT